MENTLKIKGDFTEESILEFLTDSLADTLYIQRGDIDPDKKFIDLGLDSIIAVEWAKTINQKFGITLIATRVYDYPCARDFAAFLSRELGQDAEAEHEAAQPPVIAKPVPETVSVQPQAQPAPVLSSVLFKKRDNKGLKTNRFIKVKNPQDCPPPSENTEKIAVVGMSGRYPGANNVEEYWENLARGRNSVREIPVSRWDMSQYYDPRPSVNGKINCKWMGMVDDADQFDSLFFNISPAEAEVMDPQQRLFLQEGYKAFEDAGYSPKLLNNKKCGVYLGIISNDYGILLYQNQTGNENITGSSFAIAAARLPYFLNLKGPAIPIDTACSSSLVAAYLASQALSNHDIDMALIGGVSLYLAPESYIGMSKAGMLSPEGQCKAFDNGADGFVPAEGAGALVLKRLKDAERDHDHIYGVIIASGINQDGKTNGITAPSMNSQIELIRGIYDKFHIDPESIDYVEMHGTGTKLGDPIELEAISTVFKEKTKKRNFCGIGSVKSNLGHTSAAAGVASIQKVLLSMNHRKMVPTLNVKKPNEHFNFQESPFFINTELRDWGKKTALRRSGVSSFGFSGTNAHMVVEEYQEKDRTPTGSNVLIVLSAKSETQLRIYAENLKKWMESQAEVNLADIAYTLQTGRAEMEFRLAFPADSKGSVIRSLDGFISSNPPAGIFSGEAAGGKAGIKLSGSKEESKALLTEWMDNKRWDKIAEFWVKGLKLDWELLYENSKPYRISLPTYPFAKERCWIAIREPRKEVKTDAPRAEKAVLVKDWRRKDHKSNGKRPEGLTVVLCTGLTRGTASRLFKNNQNMETLLAVHGDKTDFYAVSSGEELYRQIQEKKAGRRLLGVIDMTAFDAKYEDSLEVESGKVRLLQKLMENDRNDGFKLLQITCGIQPFQGPASLNGARLAGLYRMLGSEYRQIESMTMDTDLTLEDEHKLLQQIEGEFFNKDSLSECCYRKEARYEPFLSAAMDNGKIEAAQKPAGYSKEDVVLITGGSRGLGAAVAEHIVSQGVKNLVILGREKLPDVNDWKKTMENGDKPETTDRIKRLQSYVDRGVKIKYSNVSLTDKEALKAMVRKVHDTFGPITGVFHCAGLLSQGPAFYKKEMADIESVHEPKMKGMVTLHRALSEEPLSFFVLFSSISSIVPAMAAGYSDYAAANGFMDYYAMNQEKEGKRIVRSIQWPAWGETGMAAIGQTPAYRKTGLAALSTSEGLGFLDLLRANFKSVSLPCMILPGEFKAENLLEKDAGLGIPNPAVKNKTGQPEAVIPELGTLRPLIYEWLIDIFMSELKLKREQIKDEKPFDEYGVDSIILAQISQTLQKKLEAPVAPPVMLEYRTIHDLTDYFFKNHALALQPVLGGEAGLSSGAIEAVEDKAAPEEKQAPVKEGSLKNNDDIAVIGISCRMPGAPTKVDYWKLLLQGKSAVRPVPSSRWAARANRKDYGGWVDDIEMFDPGFFNLKDNDAAIMDPQARMIMEEGLKAIYDAGYNHKDLSGGKIGVYVGGRAQMSADIHAVLSANNPILGVGQNYLATNISRFFNFNGPSVVIDTACSSGLVAMSMAADSLKAGRIDMAMIGAVNLILNPFTHEMFDVRNILSKTGEFHIFDKRSGGEVLGEGAGVVMLKRLKDAVRDGDRIYGVIKGIAVNNDGRTLGPGSPNIEAQKQVMKEALEMSGKKIEDIGYIEVNGGGSPIMDSIEIKSLSEIYQLGNLDLKACAVGSIKPNIGHLLITSSMAGFIRCMLSLYYKKIPPFLSAQEPFDYFDFKSSRILFNREAVDWKSEYGKKRAAVQNSYPDGGTNCHIVMEEFVDFEYVQKHDSILVPEMQRRRFPVAQAVIPDHPETERDPVPAKSEEIHKKLIIQQPQTSNQNFWGKIQ